MSGGGEPPPPQAAIHIISVLNSSAGPAGVSWSDSGALVASETLAPAGRSQRSFPIGHPVSVTITSSGSVQPGSPPQPPSMCVINSAAFPAANISIELLASRQCSAH